MLAAAAARVALELRLGEAAGQLGVGAHRGEVEAGLAVLAEAVAEVAEETLVALLAVTPEAVLGGVGERGEAVERARGRRPS